MSFVSRLFVLSLGQNPNPEGVPMVIDLRFLPRDPALPSGSVRRVRSAVASTATFYLNGPG